MARPTHDIVATLGEYTAADGTKKKRYHTCGKAFTNDKGQVSLKLDALPCSPEWSGWLSLYPVKTDEQRADPRPVPRSMPPAPAADGPDEDDDIPF
jgi:hypothetical protein